MPVKVAIIIDDIGYQKVDPLLIKLPYALTFAVMPFTPQGAEMAALAATRKKEVMLHMPMEAVAQNHLLGKGALRQTMDRQQVQTALTTALAQVPQAVGVNNHMGSLFTSLADPMAWTMQVMAERNLYFIDSKTTGRSAVPAAAARYGIPSRSRDIFLDNNKSYAAIDHQFNQLIALAKRQGSAIAIGHPYPETYAYLKKNLATLAGHGIEVVPASRLLALTPTPQPHHQALANQESRPQDIMHTEHKPQPLKPVPSSMPTSADAASKQQATAASDAALTPSTQTASSAATAATQQLEPVVEVPVMELQPWHPPYLPDLPGQLMPEPNTAAEPRAFTLNWLSQ